MTQFVKHHRYGVLTLLLLAFLVCLPRLGLQPYFVYLITYSLIWVILTQGLNVIQGFTGYVSIAQSSFFGIGAYTVALLTVRLGVNFWLALLASVLVSAVAGVVIGYPALKTHGHYFSILTLGFCMIFWLILMTFANFTGGEAGIPKIPNPPSIFGLDFSTKVGMYYFILPFAVLTVFVIARLKNSKIGRAFVTIRENEQLAQALGISLVKYKLLAFVISSTLGGLAGALYAPFSHYINPTSFSVEYSMNAILAVIMGGSGTVAGPIAGSFLFVFLPEYLRMADTYRMIIYGVLLILITIFMPKGIVHAVKCLADLGKEKLMNKEKIKTVEGPLKETL